MGNRRKTRKCKSVIEGIVRHANGGREQKEHMFLFLYSSLCYTLPPFTVNVSIVPVW
jgi:hypothetical protein